MYLRKMSSEDTARFFKMYERGRKMVAARRRRDLQAAKRLTVGILAVLVGIDGKASREKGPIVKIARGRATVALPSSVKGGVLEHTVPASLVRMCK
jgi:hypothetical protein